MFNRLLATGLCMAGLAASAQADPAQLKIVRCDWNERGSLYQSVVCNNSTQFRFYARGPEYSHAIRFKAPNTHCSKVRYLLSSRSRQIKTTRLLGPGESQDYVLRLLPEGTFTINIRAEGVRGGCNTGVLSSWGVIVQLVGYR